MHLDRLPEFRGELFHLRPQLLIATDRDREVQRLDGEQTTHNAERAIAARIDHVKHPRRLEWRPFETLARKLRGDGKSQRAHLSGRDARLDHHGRAVFVGHDVGVARAAVPHRVDRDRIRDDGVELKRAALREKLLEEITVRGVNREHRARLFFIENPPQQPVHGTEKRKQNPDERQAIEKLIEGGPHPRRRVDQIDVTAPRSLVKRAAGQREKIDDFRVHSELGKGLLETARGGIVAFTIGRSQEQDFRHGRGVFGREEKK